MSDMAKHSQRMTADQMRRAAMWLLASGVAAIAAIVSYSHIYALGRDHGGTGTPARLLPLSVDMLILVGELMLLHEADAKGRRFVLGWVLVWSGILATLAANVTFGAQFGAVGAVIWGWPAYSFILAAAGMVSVVKRTTLARETVATEAISEVTPEVIPEITTEVTPEVTTEVAVEASSVVTTEASDVVTAEDTPEAIPEATPVVIPEVTPRRRRVVPAKATDDELAAIILDATEDPAGLTNYKVNKAIKAACGGKGVGETRAARLVDLAQRTHRAQVVVPMEARR